MISSLFPALPTLGSAFAPEVQRLLEAIRTEAKERLEGARFPTPRDEDWRYTDVTALAQIPWHWSEEASSMGFTPLMESAQQLVFQNGLWRGDPSAMPPSEVLIRGSVAGNAAGFSSLLSAHLDQYTDSSDVLAHLNSAALRDVSLIYAPRHVRYELPIQLYFGTGGNHITSHPRTLVIAAPHSSLTIVEIHEGNDDVYWANPVTEIHLGEYGRLHHVIVQQQGARAYHTATTRVVQSKGSSYHLQTIDLGAQLSRHTLHIDQQGPETQTELEGLVMVKGTQLSDTHSTIVHHHPQGQSRQLHKCIAQGSGHGVFSGKIKVTQAAQLTDASQMSRTLLLSPQARVDTKPQLEIVADNVKCAHGATVSQLDPEEQFYLQSRGIDALSAANLLTYAFAGEILQSIPIPSLRQRLEAFCLHQALEP